MKFLKLKVLSQNNILGSPGINYSYETIYVNPVSVGCVSMTVDKKPGACQITIGYITYQIELPMNILIKMLENPDSELVKTLYEE
jgi:hypothetical protein